MNLVYPQHKNILVLGASGFTGKALVDCLNQNNNSNQITLLQHHQTLPSGKYNILNASLQTISFAQLQSCNPDIIIHLARINASRFGRIGRKQAASQGYKANTRLLQMIAKLEKPVRLVYLSGSLMYGPGIHNESAPQNPISFAREYQKAEKPFLNALPSNLSFLMVRAPWILGDGSWFKSFYLNTIAQKHIIPMYSLPLFQMNLIGVHDCASALLQLSATNKKGIFNLCCSNPINYADFIAALQHHFPGLPTQSIRFNTILKRATHEAFSQQILLKTERPEVLSCIHFQQPNAMHLLNETLFRLTENK